MVRVWIKAGMHTVFMGEKKSHNIPSVLLAVLEKENVYIAFDHKDTDVIHINKRKFGFFKLCWHQKKEKWFVSAYRYIKETWIHRLRYKPQSEKSLQLMYIVQEITEPTQNTA